ncbi:LysM peptidoglycan-binding domain-containing protein [Hyphobacterium sp. CCMP332]|jgi:nucleoid-associated protein YgaU|uniref:LysM peptidoglycan-binding domain-containing protein n=1 Tax=Hyphobacterium sp. CCMP332 TaxID=2749086 RepID=UPI00164FAB0C|nr:LysM peptidoglycan-binding domain-containing protein [Hyphobacterium sp. CCMP332]QNL19101.1 LysM peptidoglycan-binding domain-containing protein [Hyphobacterium sp. CCMP332]
MTAMRSLILAAILGALAIGAAAVFVLTRAPAPVEVADTSAPAQSAVSDDMLPTTPAPTFDIVRIDPAGTAVIAGRGVPEWTLEILADGDAIAEADIDDRGEWVIIINQPLPAGSIELSLAMQSPTGEIITSEQTVLVSIPESRDEIPLVIITRPGEASEVRQGPMSGVSTGPLSLETVDYDDEGAVIFAGRATPGNRVRVFANGAIVGETSANPDGRWSMRAAETLAPGVYDLQIDMLSVDGQVVAVIALPFERVAPEDIQLGEGRVIVQPGNSLWRIARRVYGEGLRYTVIYRANQDQIRDPDLIYPGQVFSTPSQGDIPQDENDDG